MRDPAPLHVLIVDDDRDTADSLELFLRRVGHHAQAVYDSEGALTSAAARPPDAVVLDLAMPGLNGFDLAYQLTRLPGMERTLLVCLTGYADEEYRRRAFEVGFDHYLVKPFDPEELEQLLGSQAPRKSTRQA